MTRLVFQIPLLIVLLVSSVLLFFYNTGQEPFIAFRGQDAWLMLVATSYVACLWLFLIIICVARMVQARKNRVISILMMSLCLFMLYWLYFTQKSYISDLARSGALFK